MGEIAVIEHQDQALDRFFEACASAQWAEPLWNALLAYLRSEGFGAVIYHHLPPLGAPDEGKIRVSADGLPDPWIAKYIKAKRYREDPLFAEACTTETPFCWNAIHDRRTLSPDEAAFLDEMTAIGLVDGMAIPVFGPSGRNGCFGLARAEGCGSAAELYGFQAVCQAAHLRYCRLQRTQLPALQQLSEREVELLHWVVRGKSNGVIAEIMEISPHTVDAYLRRVFLKLGTSNRISAAVQALSNGLIRGF